MTTGREMPDIRTRLANALKWHLFDEAGREQHALEVAEALLSLPGIAIIDRDRIDAGLDRLSTQAAQCSSVDHRERVQAQVDEIRATVLAAAEAGR